MNAPRSPEAARAFFLDAAPGKRFCIYYRPADSTTHRGNFIYVHPFGEEMNRSRRMAALQARAFASLGFGVLQIDLFGCGDSSGEFAQARWEIWKQDLLLAQDWLNANAAAPVGLWGLRLGALLALDFAATARAPIDRIILWQPVTSGEQFMTQVLRLGVASDMFAGASTEKSGTGAMRATLASGAIVEVGGYEIAPALAAAIDAQDTAALVLPTTRIDWFEAVSQGRAIPPARARVAADWTQRGIDVHMHAAACAAFWMTPEIVECPALVSATCGVLAEGKT